MGYSSAESKLGPFSSQNSPFTISNIITTHCSAHEAQERPIISVSSTISKSAKYRAKFNGGRRGPPEKSPSGARVRERKSRKKAAATLSSSPTQLVRPHGRAKPSLSGIGAARTFPAAIEPRDTPLPRTDSISRVFTPGRPNSSLPPTPFVRGALSIARPGASAKGVPSPWAGAIPSCFFAPPGGRVFRRPRGECRCGSSERGCLIRAARTAEGKQDTLCLRGERACCWGRGIMAVQLRGDARPG